jgi:hypothetical protein
MIARRHALARCRALNVSSTFAKLRRHDSRLVHWARTQNPSTSSSLTVTVGTAQAEAAASATAKPTPTTERPAIADASHAISRSSCNKVFHMSRSYPDLAHRSW